jgi:hypothetical protein
LALPIETRLLEEKEWIAILLGYNKRPLCTIYSATGKRSALAKYKLCIWVLFRYSDRTTNLAAILIFEDDICLEAELAISIYRLDYTYYI